MQRIAFLPRPEFYDGILFHVLNQTFQNLPAQTCSRHFTATEKNCCFDFVAVVEKAQNVVLFGFVIVVVHINAELHFFDYDFGLVLFGFAFLFFLLVEELAIVHDAANGRDRGRRNFHQIQVLLTSQFERVEGG